MESKLCRNPANHATRIKPGEVRGPNGCKGSGGRMQRRTLKRKALESDLVPADLLDAALDKLRKQEALLVWLAPRVELLIQALPDSLPENLPVAPLVTVEPELVTVDGGQSLFDWEAYK